MILGLLQTLVCYLLLSGTALRTLYRRWSILVSLLPACLAQEPSRRSVLRPVATQSHRLALGMWCQWFWKSYLCPLRVLLEWIWQQLLRSRSNLRLLASRIGWFRTPMLGGTFQNMWMSLSLITIPHWIVGTSICAFWSVCISVMSWGFLSVSEVELALSVWQRNLRWWTVKSFAVKDLCWIADRLTLCLGNLLILPLGPSLHFVSWRFLQTRICLSVVVISRIVFMLVPCLLVLKNFLDWWTTWLLGKQRGCLVGVKATMPRLVDVLLLSMSSLWVLLGHFTLYNSCTSSQCWDHWALGSKIWSWMVSLLLAWLVLQEILWFQCLTATTCIQSHVARTGAVMVKKILLMTLRS